MEFSRQDLDGTKAVQHLVLGQKHFADVAFTQGSENSMWSQPETPMPSLKQHVCLPFRQDSPPDQFVGQIERALRF